MSDIIEATAAAPTVQTPVMPVNPPVPATIAARDLVRLTQGLYFIFWGMLISVLVGAQILIMLWLRTFAEFFLGAGILTVLVGTWRLQQAQLGEAWRRGTRWTLTLAALTAYFCVIFYMWRHAPLHPYLQVNALMFIACGISYLILLTRTVAALATGLGRMELARESRWFGATTVVLLLLPFVSAMVYMGIMATRHKENFMLQFHDLLGQVTMPVMIVLLLPLSLTLGLVWAAKDAALRRLAELDENRQS